jgi:long-chain acyl-CoA synthetase
MTLRYQPLPQQIVSWADQDPGKTAIIGDHRILSYAELEQRMTGVAGGLLNHGVRPGDRVVIAMSSKPDFVCCTLAAMAVGAYAVPTAQYEEDLEGVIRNVSPRVIITDIGQCKNLQSVFPASDCVTFDAVLTDSRPPLYAPDLEHVALFIHTSGTTSGHRRGTMLSHRSLCGTARYMNSHMGVDREIRELIIPPLQHGFGMGRCRAVLHAGGTMVLQDGIFNPASALTVIDEKECNAFSSASSGVALLLEHYAEDLAEIGDRIHWLEMGTLPLDRRHMKNLLSLLPKARIFFTYGMTEAIRSTILEMNRHQEKLDTVGQVASGVVVRVVDEEGANAITGVTGKIQVKGVNMASGYWNADQAWQEKLYQGWVDSGDLGWLDDDDFLHFVGRQDDMINVGGLKVSPVEVEQALKPLLDSIPFAVARIPDPDGIQGFVPALFVEGESVPDIESIRNSLRDHLAEYKIPRMILHIDTLPRTTATRKVRRAELANYALQKLQHSDPTRLPVHISDSLNRQRRFSPAVLGRHPMNYGKLARKVAKKNNRIRKKPAGRELLVDVPALFTGLLQGNTLQLDSGIVPQTENSRANEGGPLANSVALCWSDDGQERLTRYRDIESAASWFNKSFPLTCESVVMLDKQDADPELVLAVEVAAITNGAALYIPENSELKSAATLLGAIHRYRVTHLLMGNHFIEQMLKADNYWNDSFTEAHLAWVLWAGSELNRQLLLHFSTRFGIAPRHIYKTENKWHAAIDENLLVDMDERTIWGTLKSLAVEIFSVDEKLLTPESAPDSVRGWDSLAFVRLVAATEERFGIRMKPRDIMSIGTLGDIEQLIERRMG